MLDRPTPDPRESGVTIGEAFAAAIILLLALGGLAALLLVHP